MARRSSKGDPATGLAILGCLAVVFIVIPAVLTLSAYVVGFCFLAGLLFFELRTGKRPPVATAAEFYSTEDIAALESLRNKMARLREQKARVYHDADHLGLMRRSHDPRRFDERKSLGKRLNSRLLKFDEQFAELASQMGGLRRVVHDRRESWSREFERWRFHSSGRLAFRVATCVYVLVAVTLQTFNPIWLQSFSATVSRHVWFPVPVLLSFYGSIVIAAVSSMAITPLAWLIRFQQMDRPLPGDNDFNQLWVHKTAGETVDDFVNSYLIANLDGDEEEEFADGHPDWDGTDERRHWYEILGVTSKATYDEIKAAYHEQIKLYHPDRVAALGPKLRKLAEQESKALNAAYEEGSRASR